MRSYTVTVQGKCIFFSPEGINKKDNNKSNFRINIQEQKAEIASKIQMKP